MTRVLVCGGRDYADWERIFAVLDKLHSEMGVSAVIHGAQRGADTIANDWAVSRLVRPEPYEADWKSYGDAAGPIRNALMLEEALPDLVIAFPTPGALNKGTKNMMKLARKAGVEVIEIASA